MKMVYKNRNITLTEKNRKFYRKDKKLSAYSFSCGHIEVYESMIKQINHHTGKAHPLVKIFVEKEGCFHVKMYHNDCEIFKKFSKWECFGTITEARKYVSSLLKELQKIAM